MTMLGAALELVAGGYSVFPIKPLDKRPPLVKGGFYSATADPAYLRYWWRKWPTANIAARTGDGLAVVDVDPRHGGTLEAVAALGLSLDSRLVRTPSSGWQLHYQVTELVVSRSGALAPGVDVKADLGYVLLPPSTRRDGAYTWEGQGLAAPRLAADAGALNQVNTTRTADGRPLGARQRKRPEDVRAGERHDQAVLWCSWFAAQDCEPDEVAELTWQLVARFADPVDRDDPDTEAIITWVLRKDAASRAAIIAELDEAAV
jgi:hypothetical protein